MVATKSGNSGLTEADARWRNAPATEPHRLSQVIANCGADDERPDSGNGYASSVRVGANANGWRLNPPARYAGVDDVRHVGVRAHAQVVRACGRAHVTR